MDGASSGVGVHRFLKAGVFLNRKIETQLLRYSMASAFLYSNGNALFFDEEDEQIAKLQKQGLCGLHSFVKLYPNAPVYWSVWRESNWEIPKTSVPWLLRHVRKTVAARPKSLAPA
jgi:hypothetical protein